MHHECNPKLQLKIELERARGTDNVRIFKSLLICCQGYGDGFDDVVIQGDLDDLKFVAFYTK